MALKSNRVGVRTDQVDVYGRVTSKSFLQSILDHLPRWTSLKVWKNGTEQLLPVNTDEPVTSPIVADIQYPTDSSATEQMFTYRITPTEEDGNAYVKSIKGNTLVWNQLLDVSSYTTNTNNGVTFTKNADNTVSITGTATDRVQGNPFARPQIINGHKYLISLSKPLTNIYFRSTVGIVQSMQNSGIYTATADGSGYFYFDTNSATTETFNITNLGLGVFDLTKMFGSTKANEIFAMETAQAGSGVAYFKSLFPLPYYQYDAGSLLSFNGTGIKTVGFNQFDEQWESGLIDPISGANVADSSYIRSKNYIEVIPNGTYWFQIPQTMYLRFYDANKNYLGYNYLSKNSIASSQAITLTGVYYVRIIIEATTYNHDICINISSSENGKYEPYITSTTTIPTDTYFPTGMKKAGNVFDEFTSSRAYTRVGEVDLGTLNWSAVNEVMKASLSDSKANGECVCGIYTATTATIVNAKTENKVVAIDNINRVCVYDSSYTSASAFKTAMDGVMLQYELAEEIIEPTLEFDEE